MNNRLKKILKRSGIANFISVFFYICRIKKIKNNKVIFINFNGKGYGDNPKYIAEALKKNHTNFEMIWVVDKKSNNEYFPKEINKVKINSLKYFYHLATAKVWINNTRFSPFIKKRKSQIYIQTWHGCMPIKKIEHDAEEQLGKYYKKVMKEDTNKTNYMISNGLFCSNLYRNAFKYSGKILEIGSPRNDLLINSSKNIVEKVYKSFSIPKNKKILLYAPTFRDNYNTNPYDINFKKLLKILNKNGNEWEIMVRFHPNIRDGTNLIINYEKIINVSSYPDMQELIAACNLFITDYSSSMFEAMIAEKPVILYTKDIKNYYKERGFYFKFEELPFEHVTNNDDLIVLLSTKNLDELKINYKSFSFDKLGLKESGNASNQIANLIVKIINFGDESLNE